MIGDMKDSSVPKDLELRAPNPQKRMSALRVPFWDLRVVCCNVHHAREKSEKCICWLHAVAVLAIPFKTVAL